MELLAQLTDEAAKELIDVLLKHAPPIQSHPAEWAVYILSLVVIALFCGSFFVLKYLLNHEKLIHDECSKTIAETVKDHKEVCKSLETTFRTEMTQARKEHKRGATLLAKSAHDARNLAAEVVTRKEFEKRYQELKEKNETKFTEEDEEV